MVFFIYTHAKWESTILLLLNFVVINVVVIRCESGILEQGFLLSALHSEKDSFGLQQVILLHPIFFLF